MKMFGTIENCVKLVIIQFFTNLAPFFFANIDFHELNVLFGLLLEAI